jgi:hypothetical protein
LELQTLCREELFCEDASKNSEKTRKRWKKFYGAKFSIYRGEGVVSRNCIDMTVARNPEDACPL